MSYRVTMQCKGVLPPILTRNITIVHYSRAKTASSAREAALASAIRQLTKADYQSCEARITEVQERSSAYGSSHWTTIYRGL